MVGKRIQGNDTPLSVTGLELAYQRLGFSIASSLLVSALTVLALWPAVASQSLVTWLFVLWAILAVRYVFASRFLKLSQGNHGIELGQWKTGYVLGAVVTGLCWGLTVFYFPQSPLDQTTVLLVFVIAGVSAFASATMATVPLASNLFMLSILLPVALWLFSYDQRLHHILAMIVVAYLGMLLLNSRHLQKVAMSALALAEKNKELTLLAQQGEARYRAQSNLLQSVLESASDVSVWALDCDYRYLMFNAKHRDSIKRLKGVDIAVGMSALDFIEREELRAVCRQNYDRVLAGHSISVESCEELMQGERLTYEIHEHHGSPIRNDVGDIVGLTIITLDITERKRLTSELADSHNFLNTVINSISDQISVKDSEYRWVLLNDVCCNLIGHPREVLLGKSDHDFLPKEQADVFWEKDNLVFKSGEVNVNEEVITSAAGITRHLLTQKSPFTFSDGKRYIVATSRDITDRKQMEDALAAREREFRTLAENSPDPIYRYDRNCRRIYVNAAVERLTGKPVAQLLGKSPTEFVPNPSVNAVNVQRVIQQVLDTGESGEFEVRLTAADGREVVVHNLLVPEFDADGSVQSVLSLGRDVTARKRMEKEIAVREQEFRSLAENTPDAIIRYDRDGRIRYINTVLQKILGLSDVAEVIGKRPCEAWPDGRFDEIERTAACVVESGVAMSMEISGSLESGEQYFQHILVAPERDADGQIIGSIAFGRDITELKRIELKNTELQQRLANMVANLPGFVYIFRRSPQGAFSFPYASEGLQELTGIAPEALSEDMMPVFQLIHAEDQAHVLESIEVSAANMSAYSSTFRVDTLHGELWIEATSRPQAQADGSILWHGVMLDVTERKRMEDQLRMKEYALDHSGDAVFLIDKEARFIYVNEQACDSLGYSRAELLTMSTPDIDPDYSLKKAKGAGAKALAEGIITFETRHQRRDGSVFPVEINLSPQEFDAQILTMALARDITERKFVEQYEQFRSHLLEFIAGDYSLPSILEEMVRGVEQLKPEMMCSILLVDSERGCLRKGAAPSLPDFYNEAVDGLEFGVGVGSCGTAAATGARVIVEDIQTHPYWAPCKEIAAQAGLGACWSQPILAASGKVLGTFAIYHREPHAPSTFDIALIEKSARLASIAIERKQAEERMELLSHALDQADPAFLLEDGRVVYANQSTCRVLGYSEAELIGMEVKDIDPHVPPEQAAQFKLVLAERGFHMFESRHRTKDGRIFPVEVTVTLLNFGGKTRMLSLARDITERKQAELVLQEKLEEISALNRTLEENAWLLEDHATELAATQVQIQNALDFSEGIINAIPDILFEMDRSGRYLNVWTQNPEVLQEQKMALQGRTVGEVLTPENAAIAMAGIQEADQQGFSYGNTIPIIQANGETRWYEHSLAKKHGSGSSESTFIVLSRDITERKRMEDELRLREREFRTLVDSLPDPFFRYDRECRRTYVNAQVERISGKSAASLLNKTVAEYGVSPHWSPVMEQGIKQVLASGKSVDGELAYQSPSGSTIHFAYRAGPVFDDQGEVSSVLLLLHDVTDIKASESKLKEALEFSEGIINAIPDLLFEVDHEGRYLNIWAQNPELLVAPKAEMLGLKIGEMLSVENAAILMEAIRQAEEHGLATGKPICIDLPQGPRWFEHTVSKKPGGSPANARFLMLSRDITERKQAERALQENVQQITALNRSLEAQASELEVSKEQLQRTEAWYRSILQSAPDGMLVINERGLITLVNEQIGLMFGYADSELIGQPIEVLVPKDVRAQHVAKRNGYIHGVSKGEGVGDKVVNFRGCRKDGSEFAVDIALSRLPDVEGGSGVICAAIRDVTERQRLEKALAAREHESRTLIENTPDVISRFDRNCVRIFGNKALAGMAEGGLSVLLGKRPSEMPGGPEAEMYEAKLREVLNTGVNTEFEMAWPSRDGSIAHSHIRLVAEADASGAVATVLAVARDITELNAFREKIHQMAFYDSLTSLPNRALFNDRLRQMLTDAAWHNQHAGVMLLDLDRFKAINDTLGHPAGDALLREAALRLNFCVRAYDTVARLGGDEFAVLLPQMRNADDLGRVAGKILASFNDPFMLEGKEIFISTSIGIAVFPDDSSDADDLVKQADSAMYFAKRSGRNNFRFYSKDLTASAGERLALESELRHALARHELELYYQPKVCLDNNTLVGSEALLRWIHPKRGLVPPDQFIPIAEDSGLIVEIGEWVLREACRTACEWNAGDQSLHKIAVNLSARQFQSNDLVKTVTTILDETGCQPEWIELEITESLLLDEHGHVLETLESFRVMGISIAIDDFGTGYSSLSYLARFPITTLKIDRSFIRTVTTEHYRAELVKAILSIARCLGQEVVAEGVETLEQAAFLQAHGCHTAQGYLYSKPVPKAAFKANHLSTVAPSLVQ